MKDFLELLVKDYHLPAFFASYIMLCFYLISGAYLIFKTYKSIKLKVRKRFIKGFVAKDLHPYFTHEEVFKYTKFYIPQYFQNITPSEGEELGKIHAAAARSKLMPEFLKKGLLTESSIKYFIILSDTGMGKTAFLINLFRKYKSTGYGIRNMNYQIQLFPLGSKHALNDIKKIEDKKNTILLLDAFDEDIKAVADYKTRMVEILNEVREFRKVVFTCRTQFFPNKEEEPTDTNDITFGENVKHSIHKLYLSAFDNRDILQYLFKKYELNIFKLFPAYNMVRKCPSLMFRPMLLTYIDDLIEGQLFYEYSFQMYKVMINKWVHRESLKPAITRRETGLYTYEEKLWRFSSELAINLYEEREKRQGYYTYIDDLKKMLANRTVGTDFLTLDDSTGRSLLNRNSLGQFKFAHKSILEYFLARECFFNPDFLSEFDFHGMDATENFLHEMIANLLKKQEGRFSLKNDIKSKGISTITPNQIKQIDTISLTKTTAFAPENFAGLVNLKEIIISHESSLPLYIVYIYINLMNEKESSSSKVIKANEGSMEPYSEVVRDIRHTIPTLDTKYIKTLLEGSDIDKTMKLKLNTFLNKKTDYASRLAELDVIRETFTNGRSERALIFEGYENFKRLKKIRTFLRNTKVIF